MNRNVVGAVLATLLLIGALYFGSPFWAAYHFKSAALAGDVDGIASSVDFPTLRESLKAQVKVVLNAHMADGPNKPPNPFASLGPRMMPAMVDRIVDVFVTPDGLAAMTRQGQAQRAAEPSHPNPQLTYRYSYRALNRFAVTVYAPNAKTTDAPVFLFERRGFMSWKLIRLELPAVLRK